MSKVKINNEELEAVSRYISEAESLLDEVENEWAENFSNLCNNFGIDPYGVVISDGFLDSLYKDAESQYYNFANLGYVISYTAQGFGTGAFIGSIAGSVVPGLGNIACGTIGGIIGAVIGFFRGIYYCVKNPTEIKWCYDSRDVFADLLARCGTGEEDNYTAIYNEIIKLSNMQLAITKIKTKINEFQQQYANLGDTATELGVKTIVADDGVTLLGFETSVNINGQEVKTTTSDALNAFYTYANTVTSGEIAADYLARTYGYDINYTDIVKNANSFMTDTINSQLYSHEFIMGVLPEYNATANDAYNTVGAVTGVDLNKIESALNNNSAIAGSVALFGGLLGSAFIGAVGSNNTSNAISDAVNGSSNTSGTTGGSSGGGYGAAGVAGGVTITVVGPTTTDKDDDKEIEEETDPIDDKTPTDDTDPVDENPIPEDSEGQEDSEDPGDSEGSEDSEDPEDPEDLEGPVNDIVIEPIPEDVELPESVEVELYEDGKVDYDEIARNEFEFGRDYDEIINERNEIVLEIEEKFATGDLEDIKAELKEYGYSSVEVEAIIADKDVTIRAILEGNQQAMLASRARELAAADGIEDFTSIYEERPNYDDLLLEGPSDVLLLATNDETVLEAKAAMDEATASYQQVVEETNVILAKANEDKASMIEIKEKYEEEYGTADTTAWSEEAALEYNEAIKNYTESLEKANEQLTIVDEAKANYVDAKQNFENEREIYYDNQRKEYFESQDIVTLPVEPPVPDDYVPVDAEVTLDPDGMVIS